MPANIADIGSAIGQVSEALITSIGATSDAKKRREYEQNIALLSAKQQADLNNKLLQATSEKDRQSILAGTLATTSIQRIKSITGPDVESGKTQRTVFIVAGVVAGVVVLGYFFFIAYKKKK